MAYPRSSNMFEYFTPKGTAGIGLETLSASAAVHGGMICVRRCQVKRIAFIVETPVVATDTAPAVEFNRRPNFNSATDEVAIGDLTIPNGTGAGETLYKDIDPVTFEVGDEMSFEHTVQAAGSPAGTGYYAALCVDSPEVPENEDKMIESV